MIVMLSGFLFEDKIEAGCDEAGRGCLAGAVFAAAVILPNDFFHPLLNDSKQMTEKQRYEVREIIIKESVSWYVESISPEEIDRINILNASFKGMNNAVEKLSVRPELLLVDGNRFRTSLSIPYVCIVKGDEKMTSIAAASVLAKTYRDDYMMGLHRMFPQYGWAKNKGYPTPEHREAILRHGVSPFHRLTFNGCGDPCTLF